MKKKIFSTLIILICICCSTSAQSLLKKYASRITVPRVYHCYKTPTAPIIDGCADDAVWHEAAETDLFVDINGDGSPSPRYATRAKMLWDDEYFYVIATMEESYIRAKLANHDDIIWHENDFEVFLDPNGDGKDL